MARTPNQPHLAVVHGGKSGMPAHLIYASMENEKRLRAKRALNAEQSANTPKVMLSQMSPKAVNKLIDQPGTPGNPNESRPSRKNRYKGRIAVGALLAGATLVGINNLADNTNEKAAELTRPAGDEVTNRIGAQALTGGKMAWETADKTRTIKVTINGDDVESRTDDMHRIVGAKPQVTKDLKTYENVVEHQAGVTVLNNLDITAPMKRNYRDAMNPANSPERRLEEFDLVAHELDAQLQMQALNSQTLTVADPNQ